MHVAKEIQEMVGKDMIYGSLNLRASNDKIFNVASHALLVNKLLSFSIFNIQRLPYCALFGCLGIEWLIKVRK